MTITPVPYKNVFELAKAYPLSHSAVFNRLFEISTGLPRCKGTKQLTDKYGVQESNVQTVVSITNRVTSSQAWFNQARTLKPQTFTQEVPMVDPLEGGKVCDFCDWRHYTAEDDFGRIESSHAVTASNLFKYCHPHQGVVLFKHHDPLEFSRQQLGDMLDVSHAWLQAAAAHAVASLEQRAQEEGEDEAAAGAQQPGNDGVPRSGAAVQGSTGQQAGCTNKGHHHQQKQRGVQGERCSQQEQGGQGDVRQGGQLHPLFLWNCLPRAGASQFHGHAQVLLSAAPFPSLQQETQAVACYNAAHPGGGYYGDVLAAYQSVGLLRHAGPEGASRAYCYPSLSPTKDMEIVVQGRHMRDPAFQRLLHAALRTLVDELGVRTFNAAIYNISLAPLDEGRQEHQDGRSGGAACDGQERPVVARVLSRGKLSSQASDYGGLEVFGGASIGHTDPMAVLAALDKTLLRLA